MMWPLPVLLSLEATQALPLTFDFGDVAEPVLSRRGIAIHRVLGIRSTGIAMLLGQLFESNRDESCVAVRPADRPVPACDENGKNTKVSRRYRLRRELAPKIGETQQRHGNQRRGARRGPPFAWIELNLFSSDDL
jgi:hypothetical protein